MKLRPLFARHARASAVALVLVVCVVLILRAAHRHYPIDRWLLWSYVGCWAVALTWGAACLGAGYAVVRAIRPEGLRPREALVTAGGVGVLVFGVGVFVAGLVGALGRVFFFAWPAMLLASGARPLVRFLRRYVRRVRVLPHRTSALALVATAIGAIAFLGLVLNAMTPENVAYDARWYHLGMAEGWAATGRIGRFDEGWFNGATPHLASFLYTWAFLLPVDDLVLRVELAAHMELVLVAATMVALPCVVERLLFGRRVRSAWAGLFLFPGILLYDSSPTVAADHLLAFFAAPIALAAWAAGRSMRPRASALLGLAIAGAVLTKYQAALLLVLPAGLLTRRAAGALIASARRARGAILPLQGTGVTALVALVATTPHWLANLVWYGDPVYPLGRSWFASRPYVPGMPYNVVVADWVPQGTLLERLTQTVEGTLTFNFVPHDWPHFHGARPVFGYLFPLVLLLLPIVRAGARLWGFSLATLGGVAVWFWTYHQDRYLQALLPWMAAATMATLALAYRTGLPGRFGVLGLIAVQLADGADVYFIATHSMMHDAPIRKTAERLGTAQRQAWTERDSYELGRRLLGQTLPREAKLLLHDQHLRLGIGRAVVTDTYGHQGAIDYTALATPSKVVARWQRLGVTHVAWLPGADGSGRVSDDLVFYDVARRLAGTTPVAGYNLSLPELAPGKHKISHPNALLVSCRTVREVPLAELAATYDRHRHDVCQPHEVPLIDRNALARVRFIVAHNTFTAPWLEEFAGTPRPLFARDYFRMFARRLEP